MKHNMYLVFQIVSQIVSQKHLAFCRPKKLLTRDSIAIRTRPAGIILKSAVMTLTATILTIGVRAGAPNINVFPVGSHTHSQCVDARTTGENNLQQWLGDTIASLQTRALAKAFEYEDEAEEERRAARDNTEQQEKEIRRIYLLHMAELQILELTLKGPARRAFEPIKEALEEFIENTRDDDLEELELELEQTMASISNLLQSQIKRNSELFQTALKRARYRKDYYKILLNKAYRTCVDSAHQ